MFATNLLVSASSIFAAIFSPNLFSDSASPDTVIAGFPDHRIGEKCFYIYISDHSGANTVAARFVLEQ